MLGALRTATLLTAAALLTACAGVAPRAADPAVLAVGGAELARPPRAVTSAEALQDLDEALVAFDGAYAGVDGEPRMPSADRVRSARAALAAQPSFAPAELARVLVEVFRRHDGHLAFGVGDERIAAWVRPGATTSAPPGPAVELMDGEVPVLAIRSFDTSEQADLAKLPALAARLRAAPRSVVDLRGNGGGNFSFGQAFVLALTSADIRRLDEREVVSAAAAVGRANSVRRRLAHGDVPASALPRFLDQLDALDDMADRLLDARAPRAEVATRGELLHGRAPTPLDAHVVVLVDGGCASACEMTVSLLRQLPGVVVAGTSTRGGMAVGELALFRLHHSGVTMTVGTRAFHDPLGDFDEATGFVPDFVLDGDLLTQARALAASDELADVRLPRWRLPAEPADARASLAAATVPAR